VEQAEARLRAAQAAEKLAASEAVRVQPLVAQGTLSRLDGERVQASLAQARAERTAARYARDLARAQHEAALALLDQQGQSASNGAVLEVRAPVAGLVLVRLRESAGPVAVGEALLEIGDPSSLEVAVELLSEDAVRVAPGMAVRLHRWGGAEALDARVRRVEPVGFTKVSALGVEEQRVLVIADIVSPPELWSRLGDGYRVEAEFILSSGPALTVPIGAVFRRGEGWALFVASGERSHERAVRIGRRNAQYVEIRDGIEPGTTVIVHPDDRIGEGTRIAALPAR
jgi:HlyD family secretion protein